MRVAALAMMASALCALVARPARAAEPGGDGVSQAFVAGARGRRRVEPIGLRVFGLYDVDALLASNTFKAVVGKSIWPGLGGGGDVIGHHWFARVAVSHARRSGSRVFVFQDQLFSLGIPVTEDLRPIEIGGGWRSAVDPRASSAFYAGAGVYRLHYRESSDFAQPGDDTDETINGYVVFGGVDVRIVGWISVGAEGQFRSVPNAIGGGSAAAGSPAAAYGETNLGGGTFRVMIGVGH